MKKSILFLSIFALIIACQSDKSDTELIQDCFVGYKSSILAGNGAEAAEWIDKKTLNYYKNLLDNITTSDSSVVASLPILEKLLVISVRAKIPKEDILAMNEKTLFQRVVKEEMISKQGVQPLDIGVINVTNMTAKAQMTSNGQATPLLFDFNKEGKSWKLDLTPIFESSVQPILQFITESKMSQEQFIANSIQQLTGQPLPHDVWQPLR